MDRRSFAKGTAALGIGGAAGAIFAPQAVAATPAPTIKVTGSAPVLSNVMRGVYAMVHTVSKEGRLGRIVVEGNRVRHEYDTQQNLGFQPKSLYCYGSMGAAPTPERNGFSSSSWLATADTGEGFELEVRYDIDQYDRTLNFTCKRESFGTGWGYMTDMSFGYGDGLYSFRQLPDGKMYRYTWTWNATTKQRQWRRNDVWTSGSAIRTVSMASDLSNKTQSALVTVLSTGELREYLISNATPTNWRSRTLRPAGTGWNYYRRLHVWSNPDKTNPYRVYVGLHRNGRVGVYSEGNGRDGNGADIRGGLTTLTLPDGTRMYD